MALENEHKLLQARLGAVEAQLDETMEAKRLAEEKLASFPDPSQIVPIEDHNIVLESMIELEKTVTEVEEQKTALRIENNRIRFELSKTRDEYAIQQQAEMAELTATQARYAELQKRISELGASLPGNTNGGKAAADVVPQSSDRRSQSPISGTATRPPIGPPPTIPVPPTPTTQSRLDSGPLTIRKSLSNAHVNGSGTGTGDSNRASARTSSDSGRSIGDRDAVVKKLEEQITAVTEQLRFCVCRCMLSGIGECIDVAPAGNRTARLADQDQPTGHCIERI